MVYWISHCVCCGFDVGLFVDQVFLALEFHIFSYILKTKSNFTLLLYIPFLSIGEWYFKCV